MSDSTIHVGIEIGTSKTCMVVGEVKSDGSLRILGMGETRSAGIRKGEISDYRQARAGVKAALLEAENLYDVESINSVYLAVTGSHISGVNSRGSYRLPDEEREIHPNHIHEASEVALDIAMPDDRVYILNSVRHYYVDGHRHDMPPLRLSGRTLDIDYHIIHGIRSRIENSIRCVRENALMIEDVVFAPVASALVALEKEDKESGALVIDMGGGTTDYALYLDGALSASGCIPVGGDHVTNDIHLASRITISQAEQLKTTEGNASGDPACDEGMVRVPHDLGFTGEEVERKLLNGVIRERLQETLELVLSRLPQNSLGRIGTGVYLTGGASQMTGFDTLAHKIFELPVYRSEQATTDYAQTDFRAPQYSTVIGLLRYAQLMEIENEVDQSSIFRRILGYLWPFG